MDDEEKILARSWPTGPSGPICPPGEIRSHAGARLPHSRRYRSRRAFGGLPPHSRLHRSDRRYRVPVWRRRRARRRFHARFLFRFCRRGRIHEPWTRERFVDPSDQRKHRPYRRVAPCRPLEPARRSARRRVHGKGQYIPFRHLRGRARVRDISHQSRTRRFAPGRVPDLPLSASAVHELGQRRGLGRDQPVGIARLRDTRLGLRRTAGFRISGILFLV